MASNGREERRRRIMERGSDRIALITGQTQTFSSPPSSSSTAPHPDQDAHHTTDQSSQSIMASQKGHAHTQIHDGSEAADDNYGSKLPKSKTSHEITEEISSDFGNQVEPHFHKHLSTTAEAMRAPGFNNMTEIHSTGSVAPSIQKASNQSNVFSCKRINSCIIATEGTRAMCSLIIASLVLMVSSESILASRPLYIVLLTDVTIVLARVFRVERNGSEDFVRERMVPKEDGDNWVEAAKLLERGLVVYQAIRGIFMDSSLYLVVVICGLSLFNSPK